MKTILELKEERNHVLLSAKDLTELAAKEARPLTADEQRTVQGNLDKGNSLTGQIEHQERSEHLKQQVSFSYNETTKPEARKTGAWSAEQQNDSKPVVTAIKRFGKLRAFPNTASGELQAYRSGQFIRAVLFRDERAQAWCTEHGLQYRAQSEGTNTAGGELVPDEMSATIIDLREKYGVFRRNTRVMPMGRDHMVIPRKTGNFSVVLVGELASVTESNLTFNNVSLTAKKWGILNRVSSELEADAIISIADIIAQDAAVGYAQHEDTLGFIGTGTAAQGGIQGIVAKLEADATLAAHVAMASGIDTMAEVTAAAITGVMGVLPQYARPGAKFYCSQTAFDVIFSRLAVTAGGNTVQTVSGAFGPSYLGYPIEVSQVLESSTGTVNGTHLFAFGDLSMTTTMGERLGLSLQRDQSRYFDTDEVAFRIISRFDIAAHEVGDTTTAGPFVIGVGTT